MTTGKETTSQQGRISWLFANLVGQLVVVRTKTSGAYEGVLAAGSFDNDQLNVVLKVCYQRPEGLVDRPGFWLPLSRPFPVVVVPLSELVSVDASHAKYFQDEMFTGAFRRKQMQGNHVSPIAMQYNYLMNSDHKKFITDTEISLMGNEGGMGERELQPWMPTEDDAALGAGLGLEEEGFDHSQQQQGAGKMRKGGGPAAQAGSSAEWDQFKVNQELFGYRTTWNEDLYTTKLNKEQISKEMEARAAKLAREIEEKKTSGKNFQQGPGGTFVNDDDDEHNMEVFDEEDLFGAVIRNPGANQGAHHAQHTAGGRDAAAGAAGAAAGPGGAHAGHGHHGGAPHHQMHNQHPQGAGYHPGRGGPDDRIKGGPGGPGGYHGYQQGGQMHPNLYNTRPEKGMKKPPPVPYYGYISNYGAQAAPGGGGPAGGGPGAGGPPFHAGGGSAGAGGAGGSPTGRQGPGPMGGHPMHMGGPNGPYMHQGGYYQGGGGGGMGGPGGPGGQYGGPSPYGGGYKKPYNPQMGGGRGPMPPRGPHMGQPLSPTGAHHMGHGGAGGGPLSPQGHQQHPGGAAAGAGAGAAAAGADSAAKPASSSAGAAADDKEKSKDGAAAAGSAAASGGAASQGGDAAAGEEGKKEEKKTKLNPNAKTFSFNPNAAAFSPVASPASSVDHGVAAASNYSSQQNYYDSYDAGYNNYGANSEYYGNSGEDYEYYYGNNQTDYMYYQNARYGGAGMGPGYDQAGYGPNSGYYGSANSYGYGGGYVPNYGNFQYPNNTNTAASSYQGGGSHSDVMNAAMHAFKNNPLVKQSADLYSEHTPGSPQQQHVSAVAALTAAAADDNKAATASAAAPTAAAPAAAAAATAAAPAAAAPASAATPAAAAPAAAAAGADAAPSN